MARGVIPQRRREHSRGRPVSEERIVTALITRRRSQRQHSAWSWIMLLISATAGSLPLAEPGSLKDRGVNRRDGDVRVRSGARAEPLMTRGAMTPA